jgi:hypothetical protein
MRGKLTEQDLTNYALNELPPDERLYAESMLGISEECRNDVYQMLDLSEMLKEGFTKCDENEPLTLDPEQRARVLDVPALNWRAFLQRAAAIMLLAAGSSFLMTRPGFWQKGGVAADRLASAGQAVQTMVSGVQQKGFARTLEEFKSRMEKAKSDSSQAGEADWQFASQPAVCTPPVWMDLAMPEIKDM